MNEQLIVKNFGPIKDATVDFRRVTVFIGPTGGGKSTLAKLAAIFRERILFSADSEKQYGVLNELLYNYEINNYARAGTEFHWQVEDAGRFDKLDASDDAVIVHLDLFPRLGSKEEYVTNKLKEVIDNSKVNGNNTLEAPELYYFTKEFSNEFDKSTTTWYSSRFPKMLYIPADRIFASAALKGLSSIGLKNNSLGKPLLDFLESFSTSRRRITRFPIKFLDVVLESDTGDSRVRSSGMTLYLHESASGIQSVAPMLSVILDKLYWNGISFKPDTFSFIIEEPELNLYPTAQQGLLNWLVEKCTKGENDLTITTHSPYILSHLNLLLYAYHVGTKDEEKRRKVAAIIPEQYWLNPDEFAAYYVNGPEGAGGIRSLLDPETKLISQNELDAVSGVQADEFDQLLDINRGF